MFLKKAQKIIIKVDWDDKLVLVFDIKNQYFYFVEDMMPNGQDIVNRNVRYTVDKDDLVYIYKRYYTNFSLTKEIRTYQYCNDKLVDTGIKWKDSINAIYNNVQSICIV